MKKRLLLCLSILLVVSCALIGHVNADETLDAKAPSVIPEANADLRAKLDEVFSTNKIYFGETQPTDVNAYLQVKKIFIAPQPESGTIEDSQWFSAYCLDSQLKYPQFSINNAAVVYDSIVDVGGKTAQQQKIELLITMAIANRADDNLIRLLETVKYYNFGPQDYGYVTTPDFENLLNQVEMDEEVSIELNTIKFSENGSTLVNIIPEGQTVTVTIKKSDLMYDKYDVKDLKNTKYEHALWILEHSYPTLDLTKTFEVAGASAELAKEELGLNDISELDDYVYMTVQYAIWKVTDQKDQGGTTIGDTINGSAQINKLYQYLIQDRSEHNGYLDFVYGSTFDMVNPPVGNEMKEEGEYYVYGPFSVKHNLADLEKIKVSLTTQVDGVSIVDESGNVITEILPEGKFYIKTLKSKKVANVEVKLEAVGATSFANPNGSDERGRIYYAYYPLSQNVVTGGILHAPEVTTEFTVNFNPKTGNTSIAAIFVMVLIGCSLAFVGISYKEKPIGLN